MSQAERSGARDLLYSRWHRASKGAILRFLSPRDAHSCAAIDIDWCEFCPYCSRPLALIETQRSANVPKSAKVTLALAQMADVECYSVSYTPSADGQDIDAFRVRQLHPADTGEVADLTPQEYAGWLCSLRLGHDCAAARRTA